MIAQFPLPIETDGAGFGAHPDHHLWRNGNVWWVAFTFHFSGRKYRVRRSLGTREVAAARGRRDSMLAQYASRPGWRLSLRFARGAVAETDSWAGRADCRSA